MAVGKLRESIGVLLPVECRNSSSRQEDLGNQLGRAEQRSRIPNRKRRPSEVLDIEDRLF